jgi:hypothetical protein
MKKIPFILAIAALVAVSHRAEAESPLSGFLARQITVTTTPTSVWALADSASALPATVPVDCSTLLINNSATVVYVGGQDVTAAATKAVTICSSGCDTIGPLSVQSGSKNVFVVVAAATQTMKVFIGGGCR